jgi:GTP cyclohydrolase II
VRRDPTPPSTPTGGHLEGFSSKSDSIGVLVQDLKAVQARVRPDGRPFVTLAYAQSVDGSITIARGERYTLSGPDSLRLTHVLRTCHDAILVGVGTVLADDPELRVRLVEGRDPQPVIVDSQLRTPLAARLLTQVGRRPWIGTSAGAVAEPERPERRARIEAQGCRVIECPARANGWVDLPNLLGELAGAGIAHVMVEGGARIITSLLADRLVDYAVVTIAPQFLGGLSAVGQLPRARTPPGPAGPRLGGWVSGRLGDDLVMAGQVLWPAS